MTTRAVLLCCAVAATAGCGARSGEPGPAPPPVLDERAVMILPVQTVDGLAREAVDAEIAYWLETRGSRVEWVRPVDLERMLARSPALDVRPGALDVGGIEWAEVERIGAPLYGDLRRLGAVSDARLALVPVAAGRIVDTVDGAGGANTRNAADREDAGDASEATSTGRVTIAAALIDTFGGTVLWFGTVHGRPDADAGGSESAAVAAQALARALFP